MNRKSTKRSNSSYQLRQQLKSSYCVVPPISERVDIKRYFEIARLSFDDARSFDERNEINNAYVAYNKLLTLMIDRIKKHPAILNKSSLEAGKALKWINEVAPTCMDNLEDIVKRMDLEEDKRKELEIELQMIKEFDGEEFDDVPAPPTSLQQNLSEEPPNYANPPQLIVASAPTEDIWNMNLQTFPIVEVTEENLVSASAPPFADAPPEPFAPIAPVMPVVINEFVASVPLMEAENTDEDVTQLMSSMEATTVMTEESSLFNTESSNVMSNKQQVTTASSLSFTDPFIFTTAPITIPPLLGSSSTGDESIPVTMMSGTVSSNNMITPVTMNTSFSSNTPAIFPPSSPLLPSVPSTLPNSFFNTVNNTNTISSSSSSNNTLSTPAPTSAPTPAPVILSSYPTIPTSSSSSASSTSSQAVRSLLNPDELIICQTLLTNENVSKFARPPPVVSTIHVILSHTMSIPYYRDDYHVSYANFLTTIPVELQYTKAAIETNRCFFIHLGIAMGLHPFLIQSWLRIVSKMMLRQAEQDIWYKDLLQSILEYAYFVDANSLSVLPLIELLPYRICFISNSLLDPIFSCFSMNPAQEKSLPPGCPSIAPNAKRDIIIYCNGAHFTLLRPFLQSNGSWVTLDYVLQEAKKAGKIVQENYYPELPSNATEYSFSTIMKKLSMQS